MAAKQKSKIKLTGSIVENRILKYHLIEKYREMVANRYNYQVVSENFEIPENISQEMVEDLRKYFLESLYPPPVEREKLDAAFQELQNFILHPSRITDLVGNVASAIFKFGLQFPIAIKSGLNAMEVHSSAKHFENSLLTGANQNKFNAPLTNEQFMVCLRTIPKKQLEKFAGEIVELFHSFLNTELLSKTISILDDVLQRMYSKQDVYNRNEIDAIELGREIIRRGHDLFLHLDEPAKQNILEVIRANEQDFLDTVYQKKK